MINKIPCIVFILFSGIMISCSNNKSNHQIETQERQTSKTILLDSVTTDELIPSINKEDLAVKDTLYEELRPIRENFKRLNSIINWSKTDTIGLEQSLEGGEAKFYYIEGQLQKIITHNYGETYQDLTEYYLLEGKLSFVYAKVLRYNRPFNYDSTAMKENGDKEIFDLKKSMIIEVRSYFRKGKLLYQINSDKEKNGYAADYGLLNQTKIMGNYNDLLKISKTK